MVEVTEDNRKKEIKGKRREKKGDAKKRRRKGPNVGIEPTASYSAAHVTTIVFIILLSQISFLMM